MIKKIRKIYFNVIHAGIIDEQDYSAIRKTKFINFTCLLSSLIGLIASLVSIYEGLLFDALAYLIWSGVLLFLIYLNHLGKIKLVTILIMTVWLAYQVLSVFYLSNDSFSEYYVILNILISFIILDYFWVSFIIFLLSLLLYAEVNPDLSTIYESTLRFSAFFIIVAFFKTVIFEIENLIRLKAEEASEAEKGRLKEKQKRAEAELLYKNRELVNFAMQITQKNELIETLNEKVKGAKSEDLSEIKEILKMNQSISKDREEFENHVLNIYEGFYSRLEEKYPGLTGNDRKLAALIRMNLSSKEISTVMNISPKSVDQSRYRLRQKMSLDTKVNLPEVLQSI